MRAILTRTRWTDFQVRERARDRHVPEDEDPADCCPNCSGYAEWPRTADAPSCIADCTEADMLAAVVATAKDDGVILRGMDDYLSRPVEWLYPGLIPRAEVTVFAGDGGLGKSTFDAWLVAQVTTGRFKGTYGTGEVLMLQAEDEVATVVKPRLRAAGADLSRVSIATRASSEGPDEALTLPEDMESVAALVRRHRIDLLIVDPITAFLSDGVDAHRDGGRGGFRQVLRPLTELAHDTGTTPIVVAHLNKGTGPSGQRIAGAAALRNAARNVLMLTPHPDAMDGQADDGRRLLGHEKSNVGAVSETLNVTIASAPALGDDGEPMMVDGVATTTSIAVVGGESDVDFRDALATASQAPQDNGVTTVDEVAAWIAAVLADGPRASDEMWALAEQQRFKERTVNRAKKRLGVVSRQVARQWTWALPDTGVAR